MSYPETILPTAAAVEFPNLEAFQKRVGNRKSALQAMRAEGLIPEDKAA